VILIKFHLLNGFDLIGFLLADYGEVFIDCLPTFSDINVTIENPNLPLLMKNIVPNLHKNVTIGINLNIKNQILLRELENRYKGYRWAINSVIVHKNTYNENHLLKILKSKILNRHRTKVYFYGYEIFFDTDNCWGCFSPDANKELLSMDFDRIFMIDMENNYSSCLLLIHCRNLIDNYYDKYMGDKNYIKDRYDLQFMINKNDPTVIK